MKQSVKPLLLMACILLVTVPLGCKKRTKKQAGPTPRRVLHQPLPSTITSKGGLVTVSRPKGEGWKCKQKQTSKGDQSVSLVFCRRADRKNFFFMLAKDYTVPPKQNTTAKRLATEIFPQNYSRFFLGHNILKSAPCSHQNTVGHETELTAHHPRRNEVKKVERVFTKGNHVIILSAEGIPSAYAQWKQTALDWFAGARFKSLNP